MDKEKVKKYIRQELNNKEWREACTKQFHQDLIIKDMVRTEIDSQTNKMINGALKYAVMEHVNNRSDFNDIMNEHKQNLKNNLQQEVSLQYKDFQLKCDSYATDHKILGRYATKDEHNSQASFQAELNYVFGAGLVGMVGWNLYNYFSGTDKKN
ncbi:hypothetical protein Klosneuvirus_2_129 [Klosneuvirus KNV1]|uniref:Uncharacterized protein n=1 Tax=Klosneuvirus KNV1 TaxID=1977640 RepID=A0A1V0SIZ9_9VIRU|nr:hypothetical protein Klosneuvirus_2_129 [Klosneuvirus KNV1]